ncbi:selenide, water dikinase SelD [Enterococcus sp. LJL120]
MNPTNENEISILSSCTSGGCGAKLAASDLHDILQQLPQLTNKNLLVGFDSTDDAAVYQLNQEGIISTLDFFSPMVENPLRFGRIAAANALSDVYAMGGEVLFALNMICFPQKLPLTILQDILLGGSQKVQEAGAVIAGGHSIYDHEPKYGLAVTGRVNPQKVIHNNTPQAGDLLILTKALGVGLVQSAVRGGVVQNDDEEICLQSMERLNKYAAQNLHDFPVHACTDVTGFGLLGHALEMAGEHFTLVIDMEALPLLPGALTYAGEYLATAGGQRNRQFVKNVSLKGIDAAMQEILFDPQTSGGLLISVEAKQAAELLTSIKKTDPVATIIGEVVPRSQTAILLV